MADENNNIKIIDEKIENQQKHFKWYYRLPRIIAIIILVLSFIWGIIDPCVFHPYSSASYIAGYDSHTYGIMQLESGFLCWLIWMLIGCAVAAIEYFIAKIALSQKILTVLYLQKLNEDK